MIGALAAALGIDGFERPLVLGAGVALALLGVWLGARRSAPALGWAAWPEARDTVGSERDWARQGGRAAQALSLMILGAVLAGPVAQRSPAASQEAGLDLLLVLDTSGSMRALDTEVDGEWRTRLSLAREAVRRFAWNRVQTGDRAGLVVFGETAFTLCPLTRDGRLLAAALDRVEEGMAGEATALGDALVLAVKRVAIDGEGEPATAPREGLLVVLLTDGRSNAGAVPPDIAARVAAGRGVRVHTVGIGSEGEVAMARPGEVGARRLHFERHDLDEETLRQIAARSNGRYFRAESSADLSTVYAEIDAVERVPRLFPKRRPMRSHPEPLLALAALLLAGELVWARGLARRIP